MSNRFLEIAEADYALNDLSNISQDGIYVISTIAGAGGGSGVTSVNGDSGPVVSLTTDDIPQGVTNLYQTSPIDHTTLSNIGTNSHASIDTHIADTTIHFTKGSIVSNDLSDISSTSPALNEVLIYDGISAYSNGIVDHNNLSNKGTNTHAQIDTHVADTTIHFNKSSVQTTDLSDISNTPAVEDDIFRYNAGEWHGIQLTSDDITEGTTNYYSDKPITTTSPQGGEVLMWSQANAQYENTALGSGQEIPSSDIYLNMKFNGDALDSSVNGRDGTLSGSSTYQTGKINQAIELLDGTNDNVTWASPDNAPFDYSDPFSVEFWIYLVSSPGSGDKYIITNQPNSGIIGWHIAYNYNQGRFLIELRNATGNRLYVQYDYALSDATWYHVVVTHGILGGGNMPSDIRLYINGTVLNNQSVNNNTLTSSIVSSDLLRLNGRDPATGNDLNMRIDELTIYNIELIADMITARYNSGDGKETFEYTTNTLVNLGDTLISSPTLNQGLVYNGSLWVNQSIVTALNDLTDVQSSATVTGDILSYNTGNAQYENNSPNTLGLITVSDTQTLENKTIANANNDISANKLNLLDINTSDLTDNHVLTYESASGDIVLKAPTGGGGASALNDLTDVTLTSTASGNILYTSDGSLFVNASPDTASVVDKTTSQVLTNKDLSASSNQCNATSINGISVDPIPSVDDVLLRYNDTSGSFQAVIHRLNNTQDVNINTPLDTNFLRYNSTGGEWQNSDIAIADVTSLQTNLNVLESSLVTGGGGYNNNFTNVNLNDENTLTYNGNSIAYISRTEQLYPNVQELTLSTGWPAPSTAWYDGVSGSAINFNDAAATFFRVNYDMGSPIAVTKMEYGFFASGTQMDDSDILLYGSNDPLFHANPNSESDLTTYGTLVITLLASNFVINVGDSLYDFGGAQGPFRYYSFYKTFAASAGNKYPLNEMSLWSDAFTGSLTFDTDFQLINDETGLIVKSLYPSTTDLNIDTQRAVNKYILDTVATTTRGENELVSYTSETQKIVITDTQISRINSTVYYRSVPLMNMRTSSTPANQLLQSDVTLSGQLINGWQFEPSSAGTKYLFGDVLIPKIKDLSTIFVDVDLINTVAQGNDQVSIACVIHALNLGTNEIIIDANNTITTALEDSNTITISPITSYLSQTNLALSFTFNIVAPSSNEFDQNLLISSVRVRYQDIELF